MKRITIMADDDVIEQLRTIAECEHVSLATVIREALAWRSMQPSRRPRFIGAGASPDGPHDIASVAGDTEYEPRSWR